MHRSRASPEGTPEFARTAGESARVESRAESEVVEDTDRELPRFLRDATGDRHPAELDGTKPGQSRDGELPGLEEGGGESEGASELRPSMPEARASGHGFGDDDDGDGAADEETGDVAPESEDAAGEDAGEANEGGGDDGHGLGDTPALGGSGLQSQAAGAHPSALIQSRCSSCGAAMRPQADTDKVQARCSACEGAREPRVQSKCSSCAPIQNACSSCAGQSAPNARVQQRCAGCGGSGGELGRPVQMWNCHSYSKPRCTRERTPLSTVIQTKCAACDDLAEDRSTTIHRAAARGLQGAAEPLPHLARLRAGFGRHDLSGVRVRIGGEARRAADDMGSLAFASGDRIAFREFPSLHLAAHEAAHTIQQRAGIHLPDGVGREGDPWERHADRVADAIVAGRWAEPILDEVAGGAGATQSSESPRPLAREGADEASSPASETVDAPSIGESDTSRSPEGEGAMVQQAITWGARKQVEPPVEPVPPPATQAPQAPEGESEGSENGVGEGEGEGGGAAPDARSVCEQAQGDTEQSPSEGGDDAAQAPTNVGSVGADDCYDGDIPEEPEEKPKPDADAPPNPVESDNAVQFPVWEDPNDACDCAALEAGREAQSNAESGGGGETPPESHCVDPGAGGGGGGGAVAAGGGGAEQNAGAGGGGGGGGGAGGDGPDAGNPEVALRESARDRAVEKYDGSAADLGRQALQPRKLGRGLKFASAKRGSAAAEVRKASALKTLRDFVGRARRPMIDAVDFGQQDIPEGLGRRADQAKSNIDMAIAAKKDAISERIDAAREQAEVAAGIARDHVAGVHTEAVAAATSKTTAAIAKLQAEHATSTQAITQRRESGLSGLNALFSAFRILHNLAGETAADGAVEEGNRRGGVYESKCKKGYKDDGFWTGCLTVRRAHAQQKAACSTAEATSKNMVTTAMRQGFGLRAMRTQFRCAIISGATQAQAGVDALRDQLTQALQASLQGTLTTLDAQRDAKLAAIEASLAGQMQKLAEQEHSQRQAVNDSGYIQQVAVEELAHASAEGLVSGIEAALETTATTVTRFLDKLTAGDVPGEAQLQSAVASADEGLDSGLGRLMEKMSEGLESSGKTVDQASSDAWGALGEIAQANSNEVAKLEQKFSEDLDKTKADASRELGQTADLQVCRADEGQTNGVSGMQKAVTGFSAAVVAIFGKSTEKLNESLTDLTQTKLAKQRSDLDNEITRNAWWAADKEQPAWVDVVAILLIIVVIALSIVATVLTAGAFSGPAALIIGALVGAVVGAISAGLITILSNWRAGERDVFQGVGQAMAIGAAGGFIGGLAGGAGGLIAGAAARGVASTAARVAINIGVNMAADMVAEGLTQAFAYFAFGQKFNLSGFVTAAITSGITSARGATPPGVRPRANVDVPSPSASVGQTLRGLRPRGGDLALGALGSLAAEGAAYLETGSFDLNRLASNFAGMAGGSAAARHSAQQGGAPEAGGSDTPAPTRTGGGGDSGQGPRSPAAEGGSGAPRPTDGGGGSDASPPRAVDDAAGAGPRPSDAASEAGAGPMRPGDGEGPGSTRSPDADGTTAKPGVEGGEAGPATAPKRDATGPRAEADGASTGPRSAGADEPGMSTAKPGGDAAAADGPTSRRSDGEAGTPRMDEAGSDLAAPGAQRPVEIGDASHTVAAKRGANGDVIVTLCSACSRMSARLAEIAGALPEGSPARSRLAELEADVRQVEARIKSGEISEADVPEAVAGLAGRLSQSAAEFPSVVGRSLTEPVFNPVAVRGREQARIEHGAAFTKIEASLGEPVPPLPAALKGDYSVDVNGRISRTPPKEGKVRLTSADGHIEVHSGRSRPTPTLDAEYVRTGLSAAETAELHRIGETPRSQRSDAEVARFQELRRKGQAVDLNAETGASLRGDARPLSVDEGAELAGLRDNDARTPEQTQRLRELEGRQRRADAAELLAERSDSSKSQSERNSATEKLGELGSDEFVQSHFPNSSKEYTGGGSGTLDGVYRSPGPPPRLIVSEAKGGSATNSSSRRVGEERVQQGRGDYLQSVLNDPRTRDPNSPRFMEPSLRRELLRALENGELVYIEVTQKITADGGLGDLRARVYDTGMSEPEVRAVGGPRPPPAAGGGSTGPPRSPAAGGDATPVSPRVGGDAVQGQGPVARSVEPPSRSPTGEGGASTKPPEAADLPPTLRGDPVDPSQARTRENALTDPNDPRAGLAAEGATRRVEVGGESHAVAAKRTRDGDTIITLCSKCRELAAQLRRVADVDDLDPQIRLEVEGLARRADELQRRSNLDPSDANHLSREALTAKCNELAAEVQAAVGRFPSELGALAQPDPTAPLRVTGGEASGPRPVDAGTDAGADATVRPLDFRPELFEQVQGVPGVTARGRARRNLTREANRRLSGEKYHHGQTTEVPVMRKVTPKQAGGDPNSPTTRGRDLEGRRITRPKPTEFFVGGQRVVVDPGSGDLPIVRLPDSDAVLPVRSTGRDVRVQIGEQEFALLRQELYDSDRIILFRVSDKQTIAGLAQEVFTVPGPIWTPASSVAFVAGAVSARKRILLATPVSGPSMRTGKAGSPAIYAREIQFALSQGYTLRMPGADEHLSFPGVGRGDPKLAVFVLDPPRQRAPGFVLDPSIKRLFDNTATWDDLPYTLARLTQMFEGPAVRSGTASKVDADASGSLLATRPRAEGAGTGETPTRGRNNQEGGAGKHSEGPAGDGSRRPPPSDADAELDGVTAEAGPRRPADDAADPVKAQKTTHEASAEEPALAHPHDPKADLAAEGAHREVRLQGESHAVAAKRSEDGDTKVTLCSRCRELWAQLRTLAESLGSGSEAAGLAGSMASRARELEQRANLPEGDPLYIGPQALAQRCRELAADVEDAARRFPDAFGRLAQPDPGEGGTWRKPGEPAYVNPYPIDSSGKAQTRVPENEFVLVGPRPKVVEAFQKAAAFKGSMQERAQYFERLAAELYTRAGWRAQRLGETDAGDQVYLGVANGKVLILSTDGKTFTGDMGLAARIDLQRGRVVVDFMHGKEW